MLEEVHQVKHREENKLHESLAALKALLMSEVYQSESKVLGALLLLHHCERITPFAPPLPVALGD